MTYFYMGGESKNNGEPGGGDVPVVVKKDFIKSVKAKLEVYSYRYASTIIEMDVSGIVGKNIQMLAEERSKGMFFSEYLSTHPNKVNPFESVVLLNNSGEFEGGVDWFKPTGDEVALASSLEYDQNIGAAATGSFKKDESTIDGNIIKMKYEFSRLDEGNGTFDAVYTKPTENQDIPLYSGFYAFAKEVGTINQVLFHDGFIYVHNISSVYKLDVNYNIVLELTSDDLGMSVFGMAILDNFLFLAYPGQPVKKVNLDDFGNGVVEEIPVTDGPPYYSLITNKAGEMFGVTVQDKLVQVNPVDMKIIKTISDFQTTYLSIVDDNIVGESKMFKDGKVVAFSDDNNKFAGDYNENFFIMRNNYSSPPTFLQPKSFVGAFFKLNEPITVDYDDGETLRLYLEIELED